MLKLFLWFIFLLLVPSCAPTSSTPVLVNPVEKELRNMHCQIWRDEQEIPHLNANDDLSGMACIGYVHGRDRSWQMDYYRRVVEGRKAEIFGRSAIREDFFLRLIGLRSRAHSLFSQFDANFQRKLWAYTYGVNLGFNEALKNGVYEFKKFDYSPEPWTPESTLSLILLQAFDQTKRSFELQIEAQSWMKDYGKESSTLFNPNDLPWSTTILKEGEYLKATDVSPIQKPSFSDTSKKGSNSWVIGPARSLSKKSWLANDPHLQLTSPPVWHLVHIKINNQLDAIGASFPGIPAIISGSNLHVSWGLTNSYLPTMQVSYVPKKELKNCESYRPVIWFKFWKLKLPFFFKQFKKTSSQLPILPIGATHDQSLVLRWTGFDLKPSDISPVFQVMYTRNINEIDKTLSQIGVPSWNFVFADDQGGIGFRAVGRVAKFEKNLPYEIPSRSLKDLESLSSFSQPLTPDEMPHYLNPKRGFIVTANNAQTPQNSRINYGEAQITSFRAFRIEELLDQKTKHDLDSLQRIQCDVQAIDARFILPELLRVFKSSSDYRNLSDQEKKVLSLLEKWNFETNLECVVCGVYRRWIERIFIFQNLNNVSLYRKLSQNPGENFKKVVSDTFKLALSDVGYYQAYHLPKWGSIHLNPFFHIAGANYFTAAPIPSPGDEHTVNPGLSNWDGKVFFQKYGASQRLIVEMSQPPNVYSILPGTEQDIEFRDMSAPQSEWQNWVKCRLHRRNFPVNWSKVKNAEEVVF